jgi:hypothetical protein
VLEKETLKTSVGTDLSVANTLSPTVLKTDWVEARIPLWMTDNLFCWSWENQLSIAPDATMVE